MRHPPQAVRTMAPCGGVLLGHRSPPLEESGTLLLFQRSQFGLQRGKFHLFRL